MIVGENALLSARPNCDRSNNLIILLIVGVDIGDPLYEPHGRDPHHEPICACCAIICRVDLALSREQHVGVGVIHNEDMAVNVIALSVFTCVGHREDVVLTGLDVFQTLLQVNKVNSRLDSDLDGKICIVFLTL